MMLSSKLYKSYYPIATENDKSIFIRNNLSKINRLFDNMSMDNICNIEKIENEYLKRMKDELSIFFKLNIDISHNNHVALDRAHDYRLKKLQEENTKLAELQERFFNGSLSIEDANDIISIDNRNYHNNIKLAIMGLLSVLALMIIFKFLF